MEEEIVLIEENDIEEINIEEENYSRNSYELPIASADTLGGIKVGENLTIDEDGTLNAQASGTGDVDLTDYAKKEEIKTINGISLIGTGNIVIEGGSGESGDGTTGLTEFVVFGDSWSDLSVPDSIWSTKVATALNLNLHNYAINSAGFVKPSTNLISTQIDTFINSNVDKTKVKYIVLLGGINDYRNGVTYSVLAEEIINCVNILKNNCLNAKILFVNNTQYPYGEVQDKYWDDLIKTITKTIIIPTYNMSGVYSNDLYNSNNYFHLTKEGQQFMAKNIFASLTGTELMTFMDERVIETEDGRVVYRTEKVSNNMVNVNFRFVPSVSKTSYSIKFDSNLPGLPYHELIDIEGNVLRGYRNIIIDIMEREIAIASETNLGKNAIYNFNIICPLY